MLFSTVAVLTSLLFSTSQKPSPISSEMQSSMVVAWLLISSAKEIGEHVLAQQSPEGRHGTENEWTRCNRHPDFHNKNFALFPPL